MLLPARANDKNTGVRVNELLVTEGLEDDRESVFSVKSKGNSADSQYEDSIWRLLNLT